MTGQNTSKACSPDTGELWLFAEKPFIRALVSGVLAVALTACGVRIEPLGLQSDRGELIGLVVSDDAQASAAGQEVLLNGGTAADAAVTVASVLAVTVPSRAGFGGGGRCLVVPSNAPAEVLDFPATSASPDRDARWRAGRPILARGLYALHARYGALAWQQLVVPAENLARFGYLAPRRLADDLAAYGDVLSNDRKALSLFLTSDRRLAVAGDRLSNVDLASVFARIRGRGPGGMFAGNLAKEIVDGALAAGASVAIEDLREAIPEWRPADISDFGTYRAAVVPLGALSADARDTGNAADPSTGTSFVAADREGLVVICHLTLNAPFGIGFAAKGQGMMFAASPRDISSEVVLLAEYTEADRLVFLAGAFDNPTTAQHAHELASDGMISPDQLDQAAAQIGFSCGRGLVDQAEDCVVFDAPPEYATGLMTSASANAKLRPWEK